jgi:hypothetical protein
MFLIVAARCPVCAEPVCLNRSTYQDNYERPLRQPATPILSLPLQRPPQFNAGIPEEAKIKEGKGDITEEGKKDVTDIDC